MEGETLFFSDPEEVRIGMDKIPEAEAAALICAVDAWNSSHGFYPGMKRMAGLLAFRNLELNGKRGIYLVPAEQKPEEGENIVMNFSFDKGRQKHCTGPELSF